MNSDRGKEEKPEDIQLPCKNCDGETYHEVLKEVKTHEDDGNVYVTNKYQVVRCNGCHEISFRYCWTNSEDIAQDPITGEIILIDHQELYPSRIAGQKELKDCWLLPPKILSLYRETHHALCNKLGILAGLGIRGLVEATCKEKNAVDDNLEKKIDDMVRLAHVSKEGAEILHGTRLLGNEAAHDTEPVPEKQLDAAMDVVEHMLIGVFILPKSINGGHGND